MKLPISPRLLACAKFVAPGDRVADIGCDHGYLSIHLLSQGIASAVIASDLREGPLQSAMHNAIKYGVSDRIYFFLSDGVANIPREFDTLICAGMGADTMISILSAAPWLKSNAYRLILQCQSKVPMLRQYLSDQGWYLQKEAVLRDGKFLYTVMEVLYDPHAPRLSPAQTYFPPALLKDPSPELPAYYSWVTEGLRIATAHRQEPALCTILNELRTDPTLTFLKEDMS